MSEQKTYNIHLVSDSTGETLNHIIRACMAQFDGMEAEQHIWSLIRNERQMGMVLESISAKPGMVLFTIIHENSRKLLLDHCRALGVPCIPVLEPILSALSGYLGAAARKLPGRQHALDTDYYTRIEAMEYALACDDGQNVEEWYKADVIVLGVSRTSKTPTCLYMANRGIFAANIPIVHGVDLPSLLFELTRPFIVGLTRDVESLIGIRRNRLRFLHESHETSYVDDAKVEEEIVEARRLCARHHWPVIDVSKRSIEETAAEILTMFHRRKITHET